MTTTSTTDTNLTSDPSTGRRRLFQHPLVIAIAGVILVLLVAGGVLYWLHARQFEETDDAFIEGNVIPVGSRVAGLVKEVLINDNQTVEAGQQLVRIDPADFIVRHEQAQSNLKAAEARLDVAQTKLTLTKANSQAALEQARAAVVQADAMVHSAQSQQASAQADVIAAEAESTRRQADLKRYEALDPRVVSQQQLDIARAAAESAEAQKTAAQKRVAAAESQIREAQARVSQARGALAAADTVQQQIDAAQAMVRQAQADVDQARSAADLTRLDLSYTTIIAPSAGRIARKNVQPGQYLSVGQPISAIVTPEVWVVANFKETQLTRMRQGQPVTIRVDAYPNREFHGHVDSIQAGTGSRFSLLPPENATGNYVKVVQRIPVKIIFDEPPQTLSLLAPGMSVVPSVRIGTSSNELPLPMIPTTRVTQGN
ncbi:MAG: HlyD family secretion protein [Phycisphaerales bacterium]|nr:HlyD family secretion protein [Phycisphaerales bacterium]